MNRFFSFTVGLGIGFILSLIAILALAYYIKGDWIEFKWTLLDIGELIYKITYAYFKYLLFVIAVIVGGVIAYVVYEIVEVEKKKEQIEEEIKQEKAEAEEEISAKRKEIEAILRGAIQRAKQKVEEAEIEAKELRTAGYYKGYKEGQEMHKQELKSLRNKMSAIKNVFKTYPELNECFKKITGWDFEKWLRKR